jgi:hypothetical protein
MIYMIQPMPYDFACALVGYFSFSIEIDIFKRRDFFKKLTPT